VFLAGAGFLLGSVGPHSLSKGKEFMEMNWFSTVLVLVAMVLVAINVIQTVARRDEGQLYVTLWYFVGSVLWLPLVWIVGNAPVYTGVNDAITNWFLGHNIIGLWFTTAGVGMMYFLIPKTTRNPLYSHKLSLIGFWTIALVYPWVGAHHLIRGPVPEWLQTIAIIFSIMMFIPVWTVITNFFKTMSGKWGIMAESVPLKFVVFGVWAYFLTCIQGPLQALRTVNQYTHLTNWTVGHAHLALFGTFSFITWGMVYYYFEQLTWRRLSLTLANWHFWVAAIGFTGFFLDLTAAGLVQGAIWTQEQPFILGVNAMFPYMVVRLVFGAAMFLAQVLFVANVLTAKRISR
jgi:cbb3-type cytochrome c oxidase subunit I